MSCPQYDWKGYLLNELAAPERQAAREHLPQCPACRQELERLRLTQMALASLPEEEIPRRIAFVAGRTSPARGWAWLWNSAPRLGFVSAAMLALAILAHAFMRPAPVVTLSAADQAAIEARVERAVASRLEADLLAVQDSFQVLQKKMSLFYRASYETEARQ